jgi:hypothetical protein
MWHAIVGITGPPVNPVGVFKHNSIAGIGGSQPLQGGPHLRHWVVPLRGIDGRTKVLPVLMVLFLEARLG